MKLDFDIVRVFRKTTNAAAGRVGDFRRVISQVPFFLLAEPGHESF